MAIPEDIRELNDIIKNEDGKYYFRGYNSLEKKNSRRIALLNAIRILEIYYEEHK